MKVDDHCGRLFCANLHKQGLIAYIVELSVKGFYSIGTYIR